MCSVSCAFRIQRKPARRRSPAQALLSASAIKHATVFPVHPADNIYLGVPELIHVVKLRQARHKMFTVISRVRLIRDLLRVQDPVTDGATKLTRQARAQTVARNRGGKTWRGREPQLGSGGNTACWDRGAHLIYFRFGAAKSGAVRRACCQTGWRHKGWHVTPDVMYWRQLGGQGQSCCGCHVILFSDVMRVFSTYSHSGKGRGHALHIAWSFHHDMLHWGQIYRKSTVTRSRKPDVAAIGLHAVCRFQLPKNRSLDAVRVVQNGMLWTVDHSKLPTYWRIRPDSVQNSLRQLNQDRLYRLNGAWLEH